MRSRRRHLLLIAASDSSGGSGLQADLRVCSAFDVHPLTALTAVTAQGARQVDRWRATSDEMLHAQLRAIDEIPVDGVKIGVLPTVASVEIVREWLVAHPLPSVLDPVLVASSGDALCEPGVDRAIRETLVPLVTLSTPNTIEFECLTGVAPGGATPVVAAAREAAGRHSAVLLKGGHSDGPTCNDLLVTPATTREFVNPRLAGPDARGTGCALATAIAAGLTHGEPLDAAVSEGIAYVQERLQRATRLAPEAGVL